MTWLSVSTNAPTSDRARQGFDIKSVSQLLLLYKITPKLPNQGQWLVIKALAVVPCAVFRITSVQYCMSLYNCIHWVFFSYKALRSVFILSSSMKISNGHAAFGLWRQWSLQLLHLPIHLLSQLLDSVLGSDLAPQTWLAWSSRPTNHCIQVQQRS